MVSADVGEPGGIIRMGEKKKGGLLGLAAKPQTPKSEKSEPTSYPTTPENEHRWGGGQDEERAWGRKSSRSSKMVGN